MLTCHLLLCTEYSLCSIGLFPRYMYIVFYCGLCIADHGVIKSWSLSMLRLMPVNLYLYFSTFPLLKFTHFSAFSAMIGCWNLPLSLHHCWFSLTGLPIVELYTIDCRFTMHVAWPWLMLVVAFTHVGLCPFLCFWQMLLKKPCFAFLLSKMIACSFILTLMLSLRRVFAISICCNFQRCTMFCYIFYHFSMICLSSYPFLSRSSYSTSTEVGLVSSCHLVRWSGSNVKAHI